MKLASFWVRLLAHIIDTILFVTILTGVGLVAVFLGVTPDSVASSLDAMVHIILIIAVLAFWILKGATPGKMILKLKIVTADRYEHPSAGAFIIRYIGYIISMIVMCIGFIWILFDANRQGWHDKMAKTIVVQGD